MNISIDYNSDLPMYEQIKVSIKENILCGKLKFNDPLPSVRQLAKELNVSTITTKRAYMDLEHEKLIYTVSGRGTFINTSDTSKLLEEEKNKLIKEFKNKVYDMKNKCIAKENLINIINQIYNQDN